MEKKNNDPIISPIGDPITSVRTVKNNDEILQEKIDANELNAVAGGITPCVGLEPWMLYNEDDTESLGCNGINVEIRPE